MLGADHPELALTLNNLAELYRIQARFDEALPLYNRALEIDRRSLGQEHPNVALGLNNLALLHYDRGAYVEAEALLHQALAIEEQALGADHPDLINTIENYAVVLRVLRRHEEAAQLEDRAGKLRASLSLARRRDRAARSRKVCGSDRLRFCARAGRGARWSPAGDRPRPAWRARHRSRRRSRRRPR